MNRSEHSPISDELLSAYIDGAVTNQEKATVEAAISADPALAWELESLRRTVDLVQALPPIALPRSFALREEQVADVLAERRARAAAPVVARMPRQPQAAPRRSFWQEFLAFFNSGNLLLRNATAVAAVLFVIVVVTSPSVTQQSSPALTSAPSSMKLQADPPVQPASQPEPALAAAQEPAQEPAVQSAADASAETAPPAEVAVAEASPAMAEVAPAAMDRSASSASLRAGPESLAVPAVKAMPNASGGGAESGPAGFSAVPADMSPIGEAPSARGGDALPGGLPGGSEIGPAVAAENVQLPEAESVAEAESAAQAEPATVEESAAEMAADAAAPSILDVQTESAPGAIVSSEPASQASEVSGLVEGPDAETVPVTSPLYWAGRGRLQTALGGLVLLLGALWLYTKRA